MNNEEMKAIYGLGTKEGKNLHGAVNRFRATIEKMTKNQNLAQGVAIEAVMHAVALVVIETAEGMNGKPFDEKERPVVLQAIQNEIANLSIHQVIPRYVKDARIAVITPDKKP